MPWKSPFITPWAGFRSRNRPTVFAEQGEFEDSPLEVRIPIRYFDMLMDGEITGSMLLTMGMLYRWSNWGNGKVKKVSASGLATATADAFHKNTYQDALQRWGQMGEIERHMTLGSHKSYPVTIHNYRK